MTFRSYLVFMAVATVLAWAGWAVVLFRLNPEEVGVSGLILFFLTLFFGLVGTFATLSMTYRVVKLQRPVISREARIAFRHAILLALASCLLLLVASRDVLNIWLFLGIFIIFAAIEAAALWFDRHQRA